MHDQPIQRDAPSNECDRWDACQFDERCPLIYGCNQVAATDHSIDDDDPGYE